jgi:predicted glutamine amidotransferase
MCRWMAWHGQPVLIEELLFKPQHSLIDQSLHSRMGAETTNGDGFGLGWYGTGEGPGVYHSVSPAWGDANLRDLAGHIESPLFLAHVRATSGTAVQQTNCHPYRHGRWLFVHNGLINDFHSIRRELMLAVDPTLFANIQGSTDSEVLFHLALTYGLEEDPLAALERTIGFVEAVAEGHGIEHAVQASIGVSDGESLWAVRYSTAGESRTLFASADAHALKQLHPENPRLQRLRDEDRIVVSEPLIDLPGAWHEIAESTALIVLPGGAHEQRPFHPRVAEATA